MIETNKDFTKQSKDCVIWCSECGKPYDASSIDKVEQHVYGDPDHTKAVKYKIEAERQLHKNDSFYSLLPYGILGAVLSVLGVVILLR